MEEIVGVIVLDKAGRHLMVKGVIGKWSFPKGRRNEGETIYEAAIREAREEAGIDLVGKKPYAIIKLLHGTYYYFRFETNYSNIILKKPTTPEEVLEVCWKNRKAMQKETEKNADVGFYFKQNNAFRRPYIKL